jgi:hypothetical protein
VSARQLNGQLTGDQRRKCYQIGFLISNDVVALTERDIIAVPTLVLVVVCTVRNVMAVRCLALETGVNLTETRGSQLLDAN